MSSCACSDIVSASWLSICPSLYSSGGFLVLHTSGTLSEWSSAAAASVVTVLSALKRAGWKAARLVAEANDLGASLDSMAMDGGRVRERRERDGRSGTAAAIDLNLLLGAAHC